MKRSNVFAMKLLSHWCPILIAVYINFSRQNTPALFYWLNFLCFLLIFSCFTFSVVNIVWSNKKYNHTIFFLLNYHWQRKPLIGANVHHFLCLINDLVQKHTYTRRHASTNVYVIGTRHIYFRCISINCNFG